MLAVDDIPNMVTAMWRLHTFEFPKFDNIHEYVRGKRGRPSLPDNADREVVAIREQCVYNVLDLVVDAFVQNLSVIGYRTGDGEENAQAWQDWQRNKMDARQAEIYTSAIQYGTGYVAASPSPEGPCYKVRSPRQMMAVYEDPQVDDWPQYAIETWIDQTDGKPRRKGTFFDDTFEYPLDLGDLATPPREADQEVRRATISIGPDSVGDPVPHRAGVCPVVRYCDRRDTELLVAGEIERLINDQRTINEVNFDRLIVARFGAFPQKVITGWTGSQTEVLSATAKKTWTFDDDTVKAFTLPAASVEPYNNLIDKLVEHVAMRAQISPLYITGQLVNVSADTVAAAEANQQRKLIAMRESYGESHEQLLLLSKLMRGQKVVDADVSAEAVWRDTEARSMGVIADAIIKVAQAIQSGAPIEPLLPLLPGVTQQMVDAMKKAAEAQRQQTMVSDLLQGLRGSAAQAGQDKQTAALAAQNRAPAMPNGEVAPAAALR